MEVGKVHPERISQNLLILSSPDYADSTDIESQQERDSGNTSETGPNHAGDIESPECDKNERKEIHKVVLSRNLKKLKELLKKEGNPVDTGDKHKLTAMHYAAYSDLSSFINVLLKHGADIQAKTCSGHTPLHYAAHMDAIDAFKVLEEKGANLHVRDKKGRSVLFVAAENESHHVVNYLLGKDNCNLTQDHNTAGQHCLTEIIHCCPNLAEKALDHYIEEGEADRRVKYHLRSIERRHDDEKAGSSIAKTPLEAIVETKNFKLISHKVVKRLMKVKWKKLTRKKVYPVLICDLIFVLIWTSLGFFVRWYDRRTYTFPQDVWRPLFWALSCLYVVVTIIVQAVLWYTMKKNEKIWKKWRNKQKHEHKFFVEKEEKKAKEDPPLSYTDDPWNWWDMGVCVLFFSVLVTHFVDHVNERRGISNSPPCCAIGNTTCSDGGADICRDGFVNNLNLSAWNNRLHVFSIIAVWVRLLKHARAFDNLGPFISILALIMKDTAKFLLLYCIFYLPYSCAFWMVFGGTSISSMSSVDRVLFTLFRITLVDEYQFDEMYAFDIVMAYILVGSFLTISAVICFNLFIALMTNTFQRVQDNAESIALMQKATMMYRSDQLLTKWGMEQYTNRRFGDQNEPPSSGRRRIREELIYARFTMPGDRNSILYSAYYCSLLLMIRYPRDFLLEGYSNSCHLKSKGDPEVEIDDEAIKTYSPDTTHEETMERRTKCILEKLEGDYEKATKKMMEDLKSSIEKNTKVTKKLCKLLGKPSEETSHAIVQPYTRYRQPADYLPRPNLLYMIHCDE